MLVDLLIIGIRQGGNKITNKKKNDLEMEIYLEMMKEKPICKKMIQEGVFTEEQLDECILTLYKNDLREENK